MTKNRRDVWQVAALIARMMQKSGKTRARISDKGMRALAGRSRLEASVREQIRLDVLEYGYLIHHLGGVGGISGNVVLALSALASAKPIKRTDAFSDDEWKSIKDGTFDFDSLRDELEGEDEDEDE